MSKAVKAAVKVFVVTFAVVTGLAALGVAFGVGTLTTFFGAKIVEIAAMSAVGVLVGGLLSKGVDAVAENFGTKVATRSATNPRQIIYGKARVGGTITHIETSGTDKYKLSMIVVLAGHEVESLEEFLINDEVLTTTSNGGFEYATNNKFTNSDNDNKFSVQNSLLRYVFLDGSQTTANNNVISNTSLGNTDKFIGISYVFVEMVFDSEAFGGGIPPMSFVVKGKKVFDPRDSSTAWSDNPALCVRDYITDTTYGLKATSSEVNDTTALGSFKVAANTCEGSQPITTATVSGAVTTSRIVNLAIADTVTLIDVGQKVTGAGISGNVYVQKRTNLQLTLTANVSLSNNTTLTFTEMAYTANGITNMSADGGGVIEGLLSSCAGKLSYIDGKFVMFAGANVTPDMTITDDNLLAPITVQTAQSSGETFNSVKAVYIDANNNYVATDSPLYEDSTLLANDTPSGESSANYKKSLEIQLPFTDTTTMAQRLQRTALLHTRKKTSLSVSCNIAFMQLQPFDWVYLTNERLGYTNKTFEVLSTNLEVIDQDGVPVLATRLDLKEIDSSVYNFASSSYTNPLDEGSSVSTGSFAVSPPTSLAVATTLEITGFDLNVSWTNNPDDLVQGTEVFYGTSSGTYIGSFIVGKSTAKESINGVGASTTYYVAVRHFSSNNVFSALTSEVSVTTGTAPISYSTGGGAVGNSDTLNVLGKNLVLNRFNSTSGGEDNENYTFLNSGNGALGGITSFQNSDTERVQLFFGEDIGGDFTNQFIALDADWDLGKGGANGSSTGTSKLIIKGKAYGSSTGSAGATSTIATFNAITNTDGYAFPTVELAPTTISGSTTTPVVVVSQGSAPSTTTNKLYNVGGSLYWNGAVVDTGAGDITGVTITTSGQSGLTGGASFASGDATFTLAIASSIDGSKTFTDDVVVQGDLTVEGTTTTIDTTNLDVQDKNITLNYGTGDTSANANGAGITIQDAVSATQDATLTWNTSNDSFNFSHPLNVTGDLTANTENAELKLIDTSSGNTTSILSNNFDTSIQADGRIFFRAGGSTDNIIQITSGGDVAFYEDTGTNTNLVWDSSESRLQHKDNAQATFGDSSDLRIYHDGSNSYIRDLGTGNLRVDATNFYVRNSAGTELKIGALDDGAVDLYYNGSKRLETTSSGINITGAVVADGLSVNSATANQVATFSSTDGTAFIKVADNNTTASAHGYGANGNDLSLYANDSERVRIKSTGDVNLKTGALQIGGQTVISSARNITAGTIDSGAIDATGSISTTGSITSTNGTVDLYDNAGNKPKIKFREDGSDAFILEYNGDGSGTGNYVAFYSNVTGWVSKGSGLNYIPANGRVGIGLTNPSEKLSVVGNISVTGTVDGRDIATDGTKLDGIEAGATTDQTQAEINALGITAIGLSGTPNITVGTINSGAIDVTGTVTSDGLTVDGVARAGSGGVVLEGQYSSSYPNPSANGYFQLKTNNQDVNRGGITIARSSDTSGTMLDALRIDYAGDISFYDDSGTSQNLKWDASADSLNFVDNAKATFGTGSDLSIFHDGNHSYITDSGTGDLELRGTNFKIGSSTGSVQFIETSSTGLWTRLKYNSSVKLQTVNTGIDVTGTVTSDGLTVDGEIGITNFDALRLGVSHGNGATIAYASNGNLNINPRSGYSTVFQTGELLAGKTSADNTTAGHRLSPSGFVSHVRSGDTPMLINRLSSNGGLILFRKDGSDVGSIGTVGGDIRVGTGDTNVRFDDSTNQIYPVLSDGSHRDASIDLGWSSGRFKDLHLSGQANVGTINNVGIKANETDFVDSILISGNGATGTLSSATSNTGLGSQVLANLTSGDSNVAVGRSALNSLTTGGSNTAVGRNALTNSTASNNVAVGFSALSANTTGAFNTAVGRNAGDAITTGSKNTIIGRFDGNQGGLDIRTANNHIVLSDGDGNPRQVIDSSGNATFAGELLLENSNTKLSKADTTSNRLKIQTNSGYTEIGAGNTAYSHFDTDRAKFYFNKRIIVDEGIISSYNEDLVLQRAQSTVATFTTTDATFSGGMISSGNIKTTNGLFQASLSNTKLRQYDISTSQGGGNFLLGKIEHSDDADGGVTGVVKAAYDYGSTIDNVNIHFAFAQRNGVARGHWWYENTDDDSGSDNISVKLIDDGSGGMFVWLIVGDYAKCFVEAYWRQCESVTETGTLSSGTVTTGTTLFDTANDPTSEHHIGKLNAHNDISVTGDATISGLLELSGGLSADQSGQTISGFSTIRVGDALIGQDVATLTTTSASQTNRILSSATTYRTLKVLVQIKSSTNFHATEILLTHNGTTVYMTEYATIFSNTSLATFDADISGGNIRLLVDPNQATSTEFKFSVSGIET